MFMREHPSVRIERYEQKLKTLYANLEAASKHNCPAESHDACQAIFEYEDLLKEARYELTCLYPSER
jgi:hypothetical protein